MICVTGYKGFIGSNVYKTLKERGYDVFGFDIKDGNDVRFFNPQEKYDVIFHLAANASIPESFEKPIETIENNVIGTIKILEYAKKTGAKVVFSSSSSIYDPVSPYAVSKKVCEEYMKLYWTFGVKSVALRYFNVFGEGQEIANGGNSLALARFIKQYKDKTSFTIYGTGEQRRDFVYVGDVVDANIKAAEFLDKAKKFEVFDIGSSVNYSIIEVVNMIDKNYPKLFLPPRIEPFENLANIKRAKRLLKWSPKSDLKQCLSQLL